MHGATRGSGGGAATLMARTAEAATATGGARWARPREETAAAKAVGEAAATRRGDVDCCCSPEGDVVTTVFCGCFLSAAGAATTMTMSMECGDSRMGDHSIVCGERLVTTTPPAAAATIAARAVVAWPRGQLRQPHPQ